MRCPAQSSAGLPRSFRHCTPPQSYDSPAPRHASSKCGDAQEAHLWSCCSARLDRDIASLPAEVSASLRDNSERRSGYPQQSFSACPVLPPQISVRWEKVERRPEVAPRWRPPPHLVRSSSSPLWIQCV